MTASPSHAPTPADVGVGMRISVHPHTDDFLDVITGALDDASHLPAARRLTVRTEAVSTYVGATVDPAAQDLASYACGLIDAASRRAGGRHVVAHLLLSRGCPGEARCALVAGEGGNLPAEPPVVLAPTGRLAVAAWSLYPLDDSGSPHLELIEGEIARARERAGAGVDVTALHYATQLRGDLAVVLGVVVDAWTAVGARVPHVVSHVTVSLDSPSQAVAASSEEAAR